MNLQKYNQWLLSVLGSLAIIGLLVILFAAIIELVPSRSYTPEIADQGIVINQNRVVDTSNYSFVQEISIQKPYQLDTSKAVFLVPISQKDQKTRRLTFITGGIGFGKSSVKNYHYSSYIGLYNNFVLIDYTRNVRLPIFKSKIALTEWAYMEVNNSQLILFLGTNKDMNKDGVLNDDDFQSLFVFDMNTLRIKELEFKNQTVREFEPLRMTSKIYVRTGRDLNKDGVFDSRKEPSDLYFYDVSTEQSETLVPEEVKRQVQEILSK